MKKCILICNLESGKGIKENDINSMVNILTKEDYQVEKHITKKAGDAKGIVEEAEDVDLIISVGGDGTFNEIVTGNFNRKKKLLLSHIPVGTTNDIGTMWGLKKNNICSNLKSILDGEVKNIDVCIINNQPFVYVAGYGKFMNVTYETPRKKKKTFGYAAYIGNAIKEFFKKEKLFELEYEINGETYRGLYSIIIISNANRIAGLNNFYHDIKLDDNKFEVVTSNLYTKKDIIKTITYIQSEDATKVPGFYCYTTDKLVLRFKEPPKKAWTIDGEKYMSDKTEYVITFTKDIKMLIPKKNIKTLFVN